MSAARPRAAGDELIALLGHSIESKALGGVMDVLGVERNPGVRLDHAGNAYDTVAENPARDVTLTFTGRRRFLREHGEPLFVADRTADELILVQVEVPSALGLVAGDEAATIVQRLGRKPYERSTDVSYGQAWWFRFDEYRLLTALDPKLRLIWLRALLLTSKEKSVLALRRLLSKQNANIRPEAATAIRAQTEKLPTIEWRRRQAAGDSSFTDAGIDAAAGLLTAYLEKLADLVQKKKAAVIYNSVKPLVRAFNALNARHEGRLIETQEREELAAFINTLVRLTGLQIAPALDVTEEWREW